MAGTPEDQRSAVGMSAGLSGQVIAASLAMLPVAAAVWLFLFEKRDVGLIFWIAGGASAFFFILSILCGGWGITAARNTGFDGKWDLAAGKLMFNCQALSGLLALLFFGVSIFASTKAAPSADPQLEALKREFAALKDRSALSNLQRHSTELAETNAKLATLVTRIAELQEERRKADVEVARRLAAVEQTHQVAADAVERIEKNRRDLQMLRQSTQEALNVVGTELTRLRKESDERKGAK